MFYFNYLLFRHYHLFYYFILLCSHSSHGFFDSGFFKAVKNKVLFYSVSPLIELCDKRWVLEDLQGLEEDLNSSVFGQHIATETVLIAMSIHSTRTNRQKPLVFSFHGWTGGGKGFIANITVNHYFKLGKTSKFARVYEPRDFTSFNEAELVGYQRKIQEEIENAVSSCPKAVFIFDEVDKYPPKVLDGIKSVLEYNTITNNYDFREAIFIFITNNGHQQITDIVLKKYGEGVKREDLQLRDFEHVLKAEAFNDEKKGGFYRSDIIKHHLIDYVIPFLPLEERHVVMCIKAEMNRLRMSLNTVNQVVSEIMEDWVFYEGLFSITGCKAVHAKVAYIKEREQRKRIRNNHQHSDF